MFSSLEPETINPVVKKMQVLLLYGMLKDNGMHTAPGMRFFNNNDKIEDLKTEVSRVISSGGNFSGSTIVEAVEKLAEIFQKIGAGAELKKLRIIVNTSNHNVVVQDQEDERSLLVPPVNKRLYGTSHQQDNRKYTELRSVSLPISRKQPLL